MNQILTNLISNAIKFTKNGFIEFGYYIIGTNIQFYVKDSGIGVPNSDFEKIFERFVQGDLKIARGYEGSGLGLAIYKGLVEILGGKIWLNSEVNKGSEFYFTIPFVDQEFEFKTENVEIIKDINNKMAQILIAEDDFISMQYLVKLLEKSKLTILTAENGNQAIEIIKNNPDISLVLMDIKMPEMNGIEATKIIRQLRPKLPIIAQTAYAFSSEREEILSHGINEYISKPISKPILLKLIEKYC